MGIDTARFALSEDLVAVMPIDVVAQVEGINRTVFTEFQVSTMSPVGSPKFRRNIMLYRFDSP